MKFPQLPPQITARALPAAKKFYARYKPALVKDFSRAKTYSRTFIVATVTGAAAEAYQVIVNADHEAVLFTHTGLVRLSHTFLYSAALSLIGLFTKSPLTSTAAVASTPVAPVDTPPAAPATE
jgi:hypothetical protein